jgi:hypothetical protein
VDVKAYKVFWEAIEHSSFIVICRRTMEDKNEKERWLYVVLDC